MYKNELTDTKNYKQMQIVWSEPTIAEEMV